MNTQALIKAKRLLYYQLLLKKPDDYMPDEMVLLDILSKDPDIQKHLEKHRQADLKHNEPGNR